MANSILVVSTWIWMLLSTMIYHARIYWWMYYLFYSSTRMNSNYQNTVLNEYIVKIVFTFTICIRTGWLELNSLDVTSQLKCSNKAQIENSSSQTTIKCTWVSSLHLLSSRSIHRCIKNSLFECLNFNTNRALTITRR